MRGPAPKGSTSRERDEKRRAEVTEFGTTPAQLGDVPTFTEREWRKLHRDTKRWWKAVLAHPPASAFAPADWHRLRFVVAPLVDKFNKLTTSPKGVSIVAEADSGELVRLADAIARQEKEFGLTPDSRQKLRWVVRAPAQTGGEQGDEAEQRPRKAQTDPRRLKVVEGNG